jgi:hypothetical protein
VFVSYETLQTGARGAGEKGTQMNKKMLTLLAAALMGFGLVGPPSAAASPDIDFSKANPHFVSSGGTSLLTIGFTLSCTSISSQGQWTTEGALNTGSTGTVQITFKGCRVPNGVACSSPGAASGEIKSEELVFHLVYIKGFLSSHTVGMLFTNNATTGRFAVTSCGNITGNGIIAHLGSPECGKTSKTLSTTFESTSFGVSRYQEIEGSSTKYHWLAGTNEASADSMATITLEPEVTATLTCP